MTRPKPTVLLSITNKKTHRTKQVLAAVDIYAVCYEGSPINVRETNLYVNPDDATPSYRRTSFTNPGSARSMARRLNQLYNTDKFEVYKVAGLEKLP